MSPPDKLSSQDRSSALAAGMAHVATIKRQPLHGLESPLPSNVTAEECIVAATAYEAATGETSLGVGIQAALGAAAVFRAALSGEGASSPEAYHPTHAHKDDLAGPFRFPAPRWAATRADHEPARDRLMRCTHCGSVHPRDLLQAVEVGATLRVADMKYGWPHKFYVSGVPNELAGQRAVVGSISGSTTDRSGKLCRDDFTPEEIAKGHYTRDTFGTAPPYARVKFYSEHLADAQMQVRGGEYDTLRRLMAEASGYTFEVWEDHRVRFWRGR